jgi:hypothetical protein
MVSADPTVWIGALLILCALSYIYKETPLFRTVEHIYIGLLAGNEVVYNLKSIQTLGVEAIVAGSWFMIIPIILGILLFTRFVPKYIWVNRYPTAFITGIGTGVLLRGVFKGQIIGQILATAKPLYVAGDPLTSFNNIVVAVAVVSVLLYFIFTFKRTKITEPVTRVGRYLLMIAFGAGFANALMGRASLLFAPVKYLLINWLGIGVA